jgi:hypothetical protein
MVMSCIDANAKALGSEPICRELAVAPSSYHKHAGRLADPAKRSPSALRAGEVRKQNMWVHEASFPLSHAANRHDALETRPEGFGTDSCSSATAFNLSCSAARNMITQAAARS